MSHIQTIALHTVQSVHVVIQSNLLYLSLSITICNIVVQPFSRQFNIKMNK